MFSLAQAQVVSHGPATRLVHVADDVVHIAQQEAHSAVQLGYSTLRGGVETTQDPGAPVVHRPPWKEEDKTRRRFQVHSEMGAVQCGTGLCSRFKFKVA